MAVRIRLKRLGRTHRPFFRICAMDARTARDGRVIEELGHYDPMLPETDARASLNAERIDYWLSVGAKPTDKVGVLIKKYGTDGTHLEAQKAAMERLNLAKSTTYVPPAPKPAPPKEEEPAAEAPAEDAPAEEAAADAPAEEAAAEATDAPAAEEGGLDEAIKE